MSWGALFESCHALAVERWQGKTVTLNVDCIRRLNGSSYWRARVCVQGVPLDSAKVVATLRFPDFITDPTADWSATAEEAITGLRRGIAAEQWRMEPPDPQPAPGEPLAFGGGR